MRLRLKPLGRELLDPFRRISRGSILTPFGNSHYEPDFAFSFSWRREQTAV